MRAFLRKALKRALKWGLVSGIILGLLLVGAFGYLTQTRAGRALVAGQVLGVVNGGVLDGELTVAEISSIWPRLRIEEVALTDTDGFPAASVRSIEVEYRLLPLLRREIVLERVSIVGANARVRIRADGSLNLARLLVERPPGSAPTGPGWRIAIEEVEVRESGGSLRDARNADARLLILTDLSIDGQVHVDGGVEVSVESLDARLGYPLDLDARVPIGLEEVTMAMAGGTINFGTSRIRFGATTLDDIRGELATGGGAAPFERIELEIPVIDLQPEDVAPFLGGTELLAPLRIQARVEGPANAVLVDVPISGPAGTVELSVTLDLSEPTQPSYDGLARVVRFQLSEWLNLEMDLDLSAAVYLSGTGITPDDAVLGARIEVGPSRILGFPVDQALLAARYSGGELTIARLDATSRGSAVEGSASVTLDGEFSLNIEVDATDLASLGDMIPEEIGPLAGSVELAVDIRGHAPIDELREGVEITPERLLEWAGAIEGTGTVSASGLDAAGVQVGRLDAEFGATATDGTPDVSLGLDAESIALSGVSIDRVGVQATFDGERVETVGTVRAGQWGLSARYDLVGYLTDNRLTVDVRALSGSAFDVDVEILDRTRAIVALDEDMRPLTVTVDPTALRVLGVPMWVDAWFRLSDRALAASISAPSVELGPLASRFAPKLGLDGRASIQRVAVAGTLAEPTVSILARIIQIEALGISPHDVDVALNFDGSAMRGSVLVGAPGAEVLTVEMAAGGIPLDVDFEAGRFGIDWDRPMGIAMNLERLKLGELAAVLPDGVEIATHGRLSLVAALSGTPAQPHATFEAELNDATFDIPFGEDRWAVTNASISVHGTHESVGNRSAVSANLVVSLGDREVASADIEVDVQDRDEFLASPDDEIRGLDMHIASRLRDLGIEDMPPTLREALGLTAGRADADVEWSGTLDGGTGRAEIVLVDAVVGALPPLSVHVAAVSDSAASLDGVVWLGLGGVAPELQGEDGPTPTEVARDRAAEDGRVYGRIAGGLDAPLLSLIDSENVATVPLTLRIEVPPTSADLLSALVALPEEAQGTVSAYVDVFGTTADPEVFGRAALRDVDLIGGGTGTVGVQVSYAQGLAELALLICDGGADGLEVHASTSVDLGLDALQAGLPETRTWPIRASVRANSDLSALAPTLLLGSTLDAIRGQLELSIEVAGTLGQPEIVGTAAIADARIGVIPLGRLLEDIDLELAFSEEGVELVSLRAQDEGGTVRGSGVVAMESFQPQSFEIDLRSRDFPLLDANGLTVFASGSINIAGVIEGARVAAEASLSDIEVDVDVGSAGAGPTRRASWVYIVGEDVPVAEIGSRNPLRIAEQAVTMAEAPSLELSLAIRTENRGLVRHQFGYVEFVVDLGAELADGLTLDGVVGLPAGVNRVLGNQFEFRRGEIRFQADDPGIDPAIDVLVVHELSSDVTEYLAERVGPAQGDFATIQIPIVGRLSELAADDWTLPLRSDPPMSEPDTLSVLVQGRLGSDTDQQAQQGTQALAQLAFGFLGDQFSGGAIDTLSIESSGQTARVEGGKYIADNLYVSGTYIRSPDDNDDNNFEVTLEWILRRIGAGSLRLELRGGDQAKGGLELLYNLRRMSRGRQDEAALDPATPSHE